MKKLQWAIKELVWLFLVILTFGLVWVLKEIVARGVREGMRD